MHIILIYNNLIFKRIANFSLSSSDYYVKTMFKVNALQYVNKINNKKIYFRFAQ